MTDAVQEPEPDTPPDHCEKHAAFHKFCSLCGTAKREHDAAVAELADGQGDTVDDEINQAAGAAGSTGTDLPDKPKRASRSRSRKRT